MNIFVPVHAAVQKQGLRGEGRPLMHLYSNCYIKLKISTLWTMKLSDTKTVEEKWREPLEPAEVRKEDQRGALW